MSVKIKNPVAAGYSKETVSANITKLLNEGYDLKQATAISVNNARVTWMKKHPEKKYPAHLQKMSKNPRKTRSKKIYLIVYEHTKYGTVYFAGTRFVRNKNEATYFRSLANAVEMSKRVADNLRSAVKIVTDE